MNWLNQGVLRVAGLLVREPDRSEWLAEWESELWYVVHESESAHRIALRFCLGAFRDALWLRRNCAAPDFRGSPRLASPARCLAFLTSIAATAAIIFFRAQSQIDAVLHHLKGQRGPIFDLISLHFLFMTIALVVLPTTTSLALGQYPAKGFRRWIFLLSKFALIFPIVFFGTLDLLPILGFPVLADGVLLGYVLAFRWAFVDQRKRCPVCLRLLTGPSRYGAASHTLFDSYGTEFFCTRGHGLLHVPENRTSYSTLRWLDLDPTWRSLFSGRPT